MSDVKLAESNIKVTH